jgi:hypothetical protein
MVGELFAGLSGFKSMYDMAKALKDINDATVRNGAIIELQEKILSAREAQSALLQRVSELEKEVARFEAWEREKQNYELKDLGYGAFAYMLKPGMHGTEPPHWVCTNCYEHGRKATLQCVMVKGTGQVWTCPSCESTIHPKENLPRWMD